MTDIDDDYDLEVLLELRRRERDEAEQRYGEAMEEHERLDEKIDELEADHRRMVDERKRTCRRFNEELTDGGETLGRVQKFERYLSDLRQREEEMLTRIQKVRRRRRRARRKMERAHDEMLEAIRQLEAVKKHFESWQQRQEVVQKRRKQQNVDEIAGRMWRDDR